MNISVRRRILSFITTITVISGMSCTYNVNAANAGETAGIQLQDILIDNDGKDWTTLSWGGATITPNTNWTNLTIRDYYENGKLEFEVKNNTEGTAKFWLGLISKKHDETTNIKWTDMEKYSNLNVGSEWTSMSFSIKELVDAFPDSGFCLDNFWYVYVGNVPKDTTLSFRNMKITSTDDERQYPFIKANQVGYPTHGTKSARISCFEKFGSLDGKKWEIINADTGESAYTGTLGTGIFDEKFSGEYVYIVNFDEFTEPGKYYIEIKNSELNADARSPRDVWEQLETDTLKSVTFEISDNVYDNLLTDLGKYYYYQRQGIEIEEKYAGEFARENLHPNDITVKKWSDRDNPNAETYDVSGGWYDAGDYGKYTSSGANSVEDLLLAYEMYPEVFEDMTLNIPESDKSNILYKDAPAILSEVKYELDMLLKLEHASKDGSFYTAANYKDDVIYLEDTLYSTTNHESDPSETDLRCHLATADMAAVLAHAYIIYKDIPVYKEFADTCLETSLRAWNWVTDPTNPINMSIGAANRIYTFKQEELDRSVYWAAGSIYRALKSADKDTSEFESYIIENCEQENIKKCLTAASVSYSQHGRSFLGYFNYLYGNESPDTVVTQAFSQFEKWRKTTLNYDNWGTDYPEWGYWWGSNKNIAQSAMTVMLGSLLIDDEKTALETAFPTVQNAFDYMLGINPISFSYVSGYGENSVENIYSAIYSKDAKLDPYKCPAGYFTEGTNNYNNPHLSKFTGKCYIDSDAEFTTNENTIYGNASMIFLTAAVMSHNKTESLTGDVNSDGIVNTADAVMLQKWLVRSGEITDINAADICCDKKINVFDLCALKRILNR